MSEELNLLPILLKAKKSNSVMQLQGVVVELVDELMNVESNKANLQGVIDVLVEDVCNLHAIKNKLLKDLESIKVDVEKLK